jgi:hypothetical protein
MLKIIQRFGKHCSCHHQGEYVVDGRFWKPYCLPYIRLKKDQPLNIHPEDGN